MSVYFYKSTTSRVIPQYKQVDFISSIRLKEKKKLVPLRASRNFQVLAMCMIPAYTGDGDRHCFLATLRHFGVSSRMLLKLHHCTATTIGETQ